MLAGFEPLMFKENDLNSFEHISLNEYRGNYKEKARS
jgi:hypothetical protein